ncbi:acyltransferase [Nocardioides sp. AE5]|uniref:acyltransferase family protein n=1 Tax=Nocardioides sp. AE5 TaxID=2962573 RepID=UPI002881C44A|nr:acyltransferase [Nocardioides sp. AE5]MDT0201935.1 acyltransferase [Nocardioides sp. AE5]
MNAPVLPTETRTDGPRRSSGLDAVRTLLVAWIIGGHAVLGYSAVGGWAWDEVQETTLHPKVELALAAVIGPSALFLMGTFFLIAGLFTPASAARKGSRRFATDRLLRLGLPFIVFALAVWPICMWVAYRSAGERVGYAFLLTGRDRFVDSGGLWFVEVLLIFTLGYLAWHRWGPAPTSLPRPLSLAATTRWALTIAVTTFVVRLVFSARGHQVLDLHVWQWPQLAGMFAIGVAGARQGLAEHVPEPLGRASGWITLACLVTGPAVALLLGVDDLDADAGPFLGGWHLESALLALYEGMLVVFGSLFLLRFAQRHLDGTGPIWRRLQRSSFAAFILQGPVLIGLAVAFRPLPLIAEVKAATLLVTGLVASFALGWLLVSRTRIGKIV